MLCGKPRRASRGRPLRPLFVSLFGPPRNHSPTSLGYATEGGLHLKPGPGGHFNPFIVPGQVVQEHPERIHLPPHFDTANSDPQRITLIHELAHYVGSPGGHRDAVSEIATVDEPEKWKQLTSHQRLHAADGFGFLATECGIGTERADESDVHGRRPRRPDRPEGASQSA